MEDENILEGLLGSIGKPEMIMLPTVNSENEDILSVIEDKINGLLSQSELTIAQINALQTLSNVREQYVRTQKNC